MGPETEIGGLVRQRKPTSRLVKERVRRTLFRTNEPSSNFYPRTRIQVFFYKNYTEPNESFLYFFSSRNIKYIHGSDRNAQKYKRFFFAPCFELPYLLQLYVQRRCASQKNLAK